MAKRPTPTKQQRDLAIKEITRLMREIALSSDKQQENELRHQLAPTSFLLTIKRLQIIRDTLIEEYKNLKKFLTSFSTNLITYLMAVLSP